jgi:hypothetical protein
MDECMLVSAEQRAVEQLHEHFNAFIHVARRATSAEVVRVRCAYEIMYEVMRFVANVDGTHSAARGRPDAFASSRRTCGKRARADTRRSPAGTRTDRLGVDRSSG